MQLTVVGAGSIGLLYAARLTASGCNTQVITRTKEQADALNRDGIIYQYGEKETHIPVLASCMDNPHGNSLEAEWVLLTIKQPALNHSFLKNLARHIGPETVLVCLQNGVGHLEMIQEMLPSTKILAAVTSEGARRQNLNTVRMTGEGELYVGEMEEEDWDNDNLRQDKLIRVFRRAGIQAALSGDMKNRIYQKLLLNAVINPLTAIYDIENGQLPLDERRRLLMRRLHEETERVLIQAGMDKQLGSWERLLSVCANTASNVSSMLADVRRGQMTEVDWINGGVVNLARRFDMETPLNKSVQNMVHALAPFK